MTAVVSFGFLLSRDLFSLHMNFGVNILMVYGQRNFIN